MLISFLPLSVCEGEKFITLYFHYGLDGGILKLTKLKFSYFLYAAVVVEKAEKIPNRECAVGHL